MSTPSTIVTIDMTSAQTAARSVAQLDRDIRDRLMETLHEARSADRRASLVRVIRETLTRKAPGRDAIGVLFETEQHGDWQFFLADTGTVLFANGDTEDVEFDGQAENLLTPEYGDEHGPEFTLAVDLRDGTFDEGVDGPGSIHARFGVSEPWHRLNRVFTDSH